MRRIMFGLMAASVLLAVPEDYFPVAPGNRWEYRNARGGVWTVAVGEPVETAGGIYYELEGYAPGKILARRNEAGDLVRWDAESGGETLVTRFGPGRFASGAGSCREEGAAAEDRGGFERGGHAIPVLTIEYRILGCADAGIESEWFAANIGPVRRVTQSIAGPVAFELVRARIGGISVDFGAHGSAALSLTRDEIPSDGSGLRIGGVFVVDLTGPGAVDLDFRSGQRFEIALVNPEGRRIWVWSADKTFIAQTARESWTGSRSFDWVMNIPAGVASPLPAGVYRVEGWITSTGSAPVFSAAAALRIGAVN